MKKSKGRLSSNSSFITNQQLLEYMRKKSNKNMSIAKIQSQQKPKVQDISVIRKKSHLLQFQTQKQNQSLASNYLRQHSEEQKNPQQTIIKLLFQVFEQIADLGLNNSINKKITIAIQLIRQKKTPFHQQSTLIPHQKRSKQHLITEQIQNQHQKFTMIQRQLHKIKAKNRKYEQTIRKYQEHIRKLQAEIDIRKDNSISVPLKQKKQDKEKLHKIILKQSELIQRQVDQKNNEKEDFLRVMRTQAQTLQSLIAQSQKKEVRNDILLNSLDLNCYLISSINLADYQS